MRIVMSCRILEYMYGSRNSMHGVTRFDSRNSSSSTVFFSREREKGLKMKLSARR